jgi:hypothetical protein
MREIHTGELLFHCWQHSDRERAFSQFASIINRGFLLTINPERLDSFGYFGDGEIQNIDVMQKARVCFTEIPLHMLHAHPYGQFAIGFTRKTLVDWGGSPAWYLPNHPGLESLKELGPSIVRGLHTSAIAVENFQTIVKDIPPLLKKHIPSEYLSRDFEFIINFTHGKPLSGKDLQIWLEHCKQAIYHTLSCVKEMSPRDSEDYRYLKEREWRIVAGAQFKAIELCRELTEDEKLNFGKLRSSWLEKIDTNDINVLDRYPKARIIDHFRFFNGFGESAVSNLIEVILVPDLRAAQYVKAFIRKHPSSFRPGGPKVQLYPSTRVRRAVLRLRQLVAELFRGDP